MHRGDHGFVIQVAIFAFGIGAGLLSLVYVNARLFGRTKNAPPAAPRTLAMMIATGLGFHNLSEGLAIGQSAATGAIAFAIVLVIGFALHNHAECFGIAAPMAIALTMPYCWFYAHAVSVAGRRSLRWTVLGYVCQ